MKTIEITQKNLIKRFHILLSKYKISNEAKEALLSGFGVESSTELGIPELIALCDAIEKQFVPGANELDKFRKRLIASIFAWRKAMGCTSSMNEVKGIACNACSVSDFNQIPKERLQSLYYAFNNKTKDLNRVTAMTQDQVDYLTTLN